MQKKFSIFPWKIAKNRPKIVNFLLIFQNFRLRRSSACLRRFLAIFGFATRLETTNIWHTEYTIRNITFITLLLYQLYGFCLCSSQYYINSRHPMSSGKNVSTLHTHSEVIIYITSTQCRDSIYIHTTIYEYILSYIIGKRGAEGAAKPKMVHYKYIFLLS